MTVVRTTRTIGGALRLCGIATAAVMTVAHPDSSPPQSVSAARGAVSGTVRDQDGALIPGAVVSVRRSGEGAVGAMSTDARGRFVFVGLPEGSYGLTAAKPGFATGAYGPPVFGAANGSVELGAGAWFSRADLVMERLAAIEGTVRDSDALPLAGVYVRALRVVSLAGQRHLAAGPFSRSDDRGVFRLPHIRPGSYVVMVAAMQSTAPAGSTLSELEGLLPDQLQRLDERSRRMGSEPNRRASGAVHVGSTALFLGGYSTPRVDTAGRMLTWPPTFHPGTASAVAARVIDAAAGDDIGGVDIVVRPVPGVRVRGRLVGSWGTRRGLVVRLMPSGLEGLGVGSEAATALSDLDGRFELLGVPPGDYTLMVPGDSFELAVRGAGPSSLLRPPSLPEIPGLPRYGPGASGGFVPGHPELSVTSRVPRISDETLTAFARQPLQVGTSDPPELLVNPSPTARLTGQIVMGDAAVPSGSVAVVSADGDPTHGSYMAVVTQDDSVAKVASFDISGMIPGEYALRTIRMSGSTIRSIHLDRVDRSRDALPLSPGQHQLLLTLTSGGISIHGVVRDSEGQPVPLATVMVIPTDRRLWRNYGLVPTWIRASEGHSDGTFRLTSIRAGQYYLVGVPARDANRWTDEAFLETVVARSRVLTLDWGDGVEADVRITVPTVR